MDELWALCYTCLSSLQSYLDFPGDCGAPACPPPVVHAADFCLVHQPIYAWRRRTWAARGTYCFCSLKQLVGGSAGSWSFLGGLCSTRGLCAGLRDEFYLAPEYQEHGIVTEKVSFSCPIPTARAFITAIVGTFPLFSPHQACVYGVAAILWATAKFTLSPNQKLAVPRKLKRLLLEMAKRTAIERPSIAAAKKVPFPLSVDASIFPAIRNSKYSPETVHAFIRTRTCGQISDCSPPAGLSPPELNSVAAVSNTFTPN